MLGRAMASGPFLGPATVAQDLNLERKLDGLVAKFPVLGFQSLEQIPIVTPFSTPGIRLRTGPAGPASWRTEEDFLPLDRVARAIPLIEDSPQISWLRTALSPTEQPCSPMRTRRNVRAIPPSTTLRGRK